MTKKGVGALVNYYLGCQYGKLLVAWGEQQLQAFLRYVHIKFYTAGYLTRQWAHLQKIGKLVSQPISDAIEQQFQLVLNHAKDIKDNKVPVSWELLDRLCVAADQLFDGYTAILAKALFVTAWGAFLRISEYSRTSDGNQHNLHRNAVLTSPDGISIKFLSDKTTSESDPIKHRLIRWWELPPSAEQIMLAYQQVCPPTAHNYFCREDGLELNRNYILNLLEPCQLMTDWRFLSVPPHSFRSGAASHARVIGKNIDEIYYIGRWTARSKAIEAYT